MENPEGLLPTPVPVVQIVQDLATKSLDVIPSRYIRAERLADVVSSIDEESMVPVIDFSKLCDDKLSRDEMEKFHLACQDWGFFQLINHGLPKDVLLNMKTDVTQFFKLTSEEKKACQEPGVVEGYGVQHFVYSDEQELDWGDMLFLVTQPEAARSMKHWPTCPATFRETVSIYSIELEKIKVCVLGLMAKNLGIEPAEKLTNMFDEGIQSMGINYYPPCLEDDKVLGISPHSDATDITFLIQVNDVQGLQIRHNGCWVLVVISTDAILVNIGDLLEILTNGKYKSIEHRVVINKNKERLSIAAFHDLNEDETIGPLPELIKEGEDKCYKSLSSDEYRMLEAGQKLDGKVLIEQMKLKKRKNLYGFVC